MADTQLKILENKLDELIALCNELNRENQQLKSESHNWRLERESLIKKNELASSKISAMIERLRGME
jgi:cell division protein ZapB